MLAVPFVRPSMLHSESTGVSECAEWMATVLQYWSGRTAATAGTLGAGRPARIHGLRKQGGGHPAQRRLRCARCCRPAVPRAAVEQVVVVPGGL